MPPGEVGVASKEASHMTSTDHGIVVEKQLTRAQQYWKLLRDSVRATVSAVQRADNEEIHVNHGVMPVRKLCTNQPVVQVIVNPNTKEYLSVEDNQIRFYYPDGRKKEVVSLEESINRLCYATLIDQYVGWLNGESKMVLMDSLLNVYSVTKAQTEIYTMIYNENTNEIVTGGLGCITSWVFRYGNRHLIPRKTTLDITVADVKLSLLTLEQTASRNQRAFCACGPGVAVFNIYEGKLIAFKKELHVRNISSLLFFNPMKFLITGARDGSIKVWNDNWNLQLVFVGHSDVITALTIYPYGPFIMSASQDASVRVWSLETCDEVDEVETEEPIEGMGTLVHVDDFYTYTVDSIDLWRVKHVHELHTSIGHKVKQMKMTIHPDFPYRCVLLCKDSSVRIINPVSGNVLTTMLLNPKRYTVVDVAYAIEEDILFASLSNGNILKYRTDNNPCVFLDEWKCNDESLLYDKLLMYEYVLSLSEGSAWNAVTKAIAASQIQQAATAPQRNANKSILLAARKDGYICVLNWLTGNIEFKIEAHGGKGLLGMVANTKDDQLISSGRDNIIKIWRVFPFAEETLNPLMSFYCAHTPVHMTVLKSKLAVAFQDPPSATYNIVTYNLKTRNRSDHTPDNDHTDSMTGLDCCNKMKLFASSSHDGTIRVWDENNKLVRCIKLNASPNCVAFCSTAGDILVAIGNHVHMISHANYLPRVYLNRKAMMRLTSGEVEKSLPYDEKILAKMSNWDTKRLKAAHSSFKYTHFVDVLSAEETEEVMREQKLRDKMFALLQARDEELRQIKQGQLVASKKPKATKATKETAFQRYLKIFYDRPNVEVPEENFFEDDDVKDAMKPEPVPVVEPYVPEREPTGFFPGPAQARRRRHETWSPGTDSPLEPAFPRVNTHGFIPNSVLIRLLWPEYYEKPPELRREEEYKPPGLTDEQLAELAKRNSKKTLSIRESSEIDFEDRTLVLSDDEEPDKPMAPKESKFMSKMEEAMQRPLTPIEMPPARPDSIIPEPPQEEPVPEPPKAKRVIKPQRPIVKFVSRPPPPPPRERTPPPPTPTPPPPREPTPVPDFIMQFKGEVWFDKYFPNCNHNTLPKPWTVDAFVQMLLRLVQVADRSLKPQVVGAIKKLYQEETFENNTRNSVIKTTLATLNPARNPPSSGDPLDGQFIIECLNLLNVMQLNTKEFVMELMAQFVDGSMELRRLCMEIFHFMGVNDPNDYFPKEMDNWDVWSIEGPERKVRVKKVCSQWLEKWITSFKIHIQDAMEKLQRGSAVSGRVNKSILKKEKTKLAARDLYVFFNMYQLSGKHTYQHRYKMVLQNVNNISKLMHDIALNQVQKHATPESLNVTFEQSLDKGIISTATYVEAINYFCEIEHEKELDRLRRQQAEEKVVDAKNTVLVLPRLQVGHSTSSSESTYLFKPNLVRLGEMHTSRCRPERETTYDVDFKLPPVTNRGHQPIPGQLHGFAPSINLPMKTLYMNPFPSAIDAYDPWQRDPILLTLKSSQKYFIPSQSYVPDIEDYGL